MRRLLTITIGLTLAGILILNFPQNSGKSRRAQYTEFLKNHPYSIQPDLDQLKDLPKRDRPDLAMYQNYLMTMDPATGEVPMERLVREFERQKLIKSEKSRAAFAAIPDVSWQEIGPDNIGGRTRAVMWDPNDVNSEKLWAAGVAGGIWFNNDITDPTSTWRNIDDFLANLAITAFAYDPTNTMTFYAGTGEGYFNSDAVRGAGIFKSTDGGVTWNLLPSTENSTFHYVQKMVVTENGTILAATRGDGVQRSTDGGNSWSTVLNSGSTGASSSRASDLEIAANGDIYASLGIFSTGSIHRSIDDGVSWEAVTPAGGAPERIELAIAPSASATTETTVIYAVATNGLNVEWFRKSTDGGSNWTDLTIPRYRSQSCAESSDDFTRGQAWYDLILAVKPTDEDVVIAGGINVLKSSDGGTTMAEISYWTGSDAVTTCDDYVHADIHSIIFRPGHPNEAVIGSDGGISYSTDLGSSSNPSFDTRNQDYAVTQFYSVAAENAEGSDYFIAGAQDNGTLQFSTANGLSAVEVFGGDGGFCFIDQEDNNFQIVSFVRNNYFLLDGSGNFVRTLADDDDSGRFINPADYDNTSKILYSAGDADELKRIAGVTTSPGTQETLILNLNGEQISALRADANTANRLFLGTGSGGVYRVENADQASPDVTDITSDISQVGYVSSIDIGANDDELIVTISGFGVSSVWYTTNGGTSWTNKDNDGSLPDMPVRWALFNPDNPAEVMLATELGVWSTDDITATSPGWEQTSDNLANVRCDMLQYRPADKLVVVATHGRGAFTTGVFAGADEDPPLVSSFDPADNSSEIRLGVELQITFNEPVNVESGNIVIRQVSDGSTFETIDVQSGKVSVNNRDLIINPDTDFEPLTEYRVLVDANAISDDFGNLFAGISDNDAWTFTTFDGDEPPLVSNEIPNQNILVNGEPIVLDLDLFFSDPDGDAISYAVTQNTNETLVTTGISDNELTIEIAPDEDGTGGLTIEATSNTKSVTFSFQVIVSYPDLLAQTGVISGSTPSQRFTDFSNSELESADDFNVTTTTGDFWYVQGVSVEGSNNGELPIQAMFRIYADESGLPGDLLFESDVLDITTTNDGSDFLLSLDEPFELSSGDYWLAVLDVQEFGSSQTQWFWNLYESGVSDYARRDPDQLLGGSWGVDWALSGTNRNMIFSIQGFESLTAPSDLTLSESAGSIMLAWADNTSSEASYVVERAIGDGEYEQIAVLDPDTDAYIDPVAATNQTLSYRVFAVDAADNSSDAISGEILSIPSAPVFGEETNVSFNQFTINWTTSDDAQEFSLDVSLVDDFSTFLSGFESLQVNDLSSTLSDVESATYFYRVSASNASGTSDYSETGTITLDPLGIDESALSIYPNPGNGLYFLSDRSVEVAGVYDVLGRSVNFRIGVDGEVDIRSADSGSYIIQLRENNKLINRTVIKQ